MKLTCIFAGEQKYPLLFSVYLYKDFWADIFSFLSQRMFLICLKEFNNLYRQANDQAHYHQGFFYFQWFFCSGPDHIPTYLAMKILALLILDFSK